MTEDEFRNPWMEFQVAMQRPMDLVGNKAYFRAVKDAPIGLFVAALQRIIDSGKPYFPKAGEIKALIEQERRALIAANPFCHCENCSQDGFRAVVVDGVERYTKCQCWTAHWQRLENMGVPGRPVAMLECGDE